MSDACIVETCNNPVERVWGITVFLVEVGTAPLCKLHGDMLVDHMSVRNAMGVRPAEHKGDDRG